MKKNNKKIKKRILTDPGKYDPYQPLISVPSVERIDDYFVLNYYGYYVRKNQPETNAWFDIDNVDNEF